LWLPLPDPGAYAWEVLATEARWVAMPAGHRLAGREIVPFAELFDEGFLALPASAGPLRDYWLATSEREGHPVRVAAEVANADETFEAVAAGIGIVLLSEINAAIYQRQGVVSRPVSGLSPSQLVVAWRASDHRPVVRDFAQAAIATRAEPGEAP
jgi:DNA-binding transcriptional LysR family regulator